MPEPAEELEALNEEVETSSSESPQLIFNWGVFLNTVIVTLSYAWIFCGVCGLVGTPLAFILLYIGGKRRLRRRLEEESKETEQAPEEDQTR
jgi:ABC-type spermidine/putrescine transport system permease subunit I